ncbi:hypothetical protein RJI84_01435 [Buchnera aphidicola (Chaitoregma tattakana)]|uniref:CAF17-like 4Fe-4S cluster assembly/insertion protein YgfZ n=1 Tax=Buchnera aphidicola TaxID=9 RepID=UPI0031B85469
MKHSFCFRYFKKVSNSNKLFLYNLCNISLVIVSGRDSKKYLQSQITNDLTLLSNHEYGVGSCCNIFGRVISVFLIFRYSSSSYAYLHRNSVLKYQFDEIKKYSVFSKVNILTSKNFVIYGICGKESLIFLEKYFSISFLNKSVVKKDNFTFLKINSVMKRFIIISTYKDIQIFIENNFKKFCYRPLQEWDFWDMDIGFPIIEKKSCKKFFPSSLNLEKFNAVSFHKGCYKGQEILSRIRYKNPNKKKLFLIYSISKNVPNIGERILKITKYGKIIFGIVVFSVKIDDYIFIQCVLNNIVTKNTILKIKSIYKSVLTIR